MNEENKAYDMNTIVKDKSIWVRLLYMLLFAFLYSVAEFVIFAVVVYQFLHVLLTGGDKDERIANLGSQLSAYVYQILQFQTFNTETKPFPMEDWPETDAVSMSSETAEKTTPKTAAAKKTTTRKTTTRKPAAKKTATAKKAPAKKAATRKPRAKKAETKADDAGDNKPADDDAPKAS